MSSAVGLHSFMSSSLNVNVHFKLWFSAIHLYFTECASVAYLNSRQHDCDQVVVGQQQGTDDAAIAHMLDDGCEGEDRQAVRVSDYAHTSVDRTKLFQLSRYFRSRSWKMPLLQSPISERTLWIHTLKLKTPRLIEMRLLSVCLSLRLVCKSVTECLTNSRQKNKYLDTSNIRGHALNWGHWKKPACMFW